MEHELLELNRRLIRAIAAKDWEVYSQLIAADVTCFEPESHSQLVFGLPFHEYYFRLPAAQPPIQTTFCQEHVRLIGSDCGVVCYVRLLQAGTETRQYQETRVWERTNGAWKNVHFHRSEIL